MRYISQYDTTILQNNTVEAVYRFGPRGILIVGDATCGVGAANVIDADLKSTAGDQLQRVYETDLSGALTNCLEMCGLGTLNKTAKGGALNVLNCGYRGRFFEAPILTGTESVPNVAGIYYEVLTGTVTYNSVSYSVGEQFVVVSGETATSGTGTFALTIPPALTKKCDPFYAEEFKIAQLKEGDESSSYFDWNDGGFEPRDSVNSPDTDFFGWTR